MLRGRTPRLDLHDFISGVIPGSILIVGILPFFPKDISIGSLGAIIPLLMLGFAFGRAVHEFANTMDDLLENDSHRDRFFQELTDPTVVTESAVEEIRRLLASEIAELTTEDFQNGVSVDETRKIRDTCYGYVRTYIHVNGRGRARTFQALLSFYQNMWMVSVLLALIYVLYGISKGLNADQSVLGYDTWIGTIGIPPGVIVLISVVIALGAYETFRKAKRETKRYYVQYLISDILVLRNREFLASETLTERDQQQAV